MWLGWPKLNLTHLKLHEVGNNENDDWTNGFRPGLPPSSTAFVHFALDVVQLLQQAGPPGLDQDSFLNTYFQGNPPVSQADRDAWWEEFKRARDYSNRLFDEGISPWAMIRARPGTRRGQYYYHIVGQRDNDRVKIETDPGSLDLLDDFTDRRWRTQTRSRQRVRAAEALALIAQGTNTGNQALIDRGQKLSWARSLSYPQGWRQLISILVCLWRTCSSWRTRATPTSGLLNKQIRTALDSGRRLERDVDAIVNSVLALAQIYTRGSMRSLP